MVTYTPLQFETEIVKEAKRLNLTEQFKNNKMTLSDCADVCLLMDKTTHNKEQLVYIAQRNLIKIKNKFSFKGLRIWFYAITHNSIFDVNNEYKAKYDNLIDDINSFHHELIADEFNTTLEFYVYQKAIKIAYDIEFGIINDFNNSLYVMIKTIHDVGYDKQVINSLVAYLDDMLNLCGDKYYRTKDLGNVDTLYALYEHLGEENLDEYFIHLNQLGCDDDGYGNSYPISKQHKPNIEDFKRW